MHMCTDAVTNRVERQLKLKFVAAQIGFTRSRPAGIFEKHLIQA